MARAPLRTSDCWPVTSCSSICTEEKNSSVTSQGMSEPVRPAQKAATSPQTSLETLGRWWISYDFIWIHMISWISAVKDPTINMRSCYIVLIITVYHVYLMSATLFIRSGHRLCEWKGDLSWNEAAPRTSSLPGQCQVLCSIRLETKISSKLEALKMVGSYSTIYIQVITGIRFAVRYPSCLTAFTGWTHWSSGHPGEFLVSRLFSPNS